MKNSSLDTLVNGLYNLTEQESSHLNIKIREQINISSNLFIEFLLAFDEVEHIDAGIGPFHDNQISFGNGIPVEQLDDSLHFGTFCQHTNLHWHLLIVQLKNLSIRKQIVEREDQPFPIP